MSRGRLGGWAPSNALRACHTCHEWITTHPQLGEAGGWALGSDADPTTSPVFLLHPYPGWFLIEDELDDGGDHLVREYPGRLDAPQLPPGRVAQWAA